MTGVEDFKRCRMSKSAVLLGAVALGSMLAAPLLGPTSALAQQAAVAGHPSAFMTNDHQLRTAQLVGKPIFNDKGENIGTITNVLVDMKGGPTTVVLSVGKYLGVGTKLVSVPVDHIKLEADHPMMAGADKRMLMALPSYTYDPMIAHGPTG